MKRSRRCVLRSLSWGVVMGLALGAVPVAHAQSPEYPLFDSFNVRLEGSWLGLKTELRLDSRTLGLGTTLSFEDTLGLDGSKTIPSLAFEWQVGSKHRLAARWQRIDRSSSAQALTEIQWGDEVIPVDADIYLGFDITQYAFDYTYYPWIHDDWAAGFGLGLRWLDVYAELSWEEQSVGAGTDSASGNGPLPYLNFEYRRMLGESWRLNANLGWLSVKVDEIEGTQWVLGASVEWLLARNWGIGAGLNYATIDTEWSGEELLGKLIFDVGDVSVFARFRW